jgi:hypothetical protein
MFSGSLDKTIKVWDANTLEQVTTLIGHTKAVRTLLTAERKLFSGSYDKTVRASPPSMVFRATLALLVETRGCALNAKQRIRMLCKFFDQF